MSLTHRQIETFRAVILTGSLTEAAEALRTSQPTVSRVLSDLSRVVGFPLFRRQGRRVMPTREALVLFEEVESSYKGLDRIERVAFMIRKTGGERIRIAAVTSVCLGLLPKALVEFRKHYPDVALVIEAGRYDSILAKVLAQQSDVGIAVVPGEQVEVHVEPIVDVNAVCVVPSDHPLAGVDAVAPRDLSGMPLIFVGQNVYSRQKVDTILAAEGLAAEPLLEVQSGTIACAMVAEGLGVAVLDALTGLGAVDARIAVRPLKPAVALRYSAMTPRGNATGRLVGALITALRAAAALQARRSGDLRLIK
jgi:DNA-binding transcriptional LysR family regulator